ncbi:MAG: hypothetical protein UV19_C0012G0004 [Parcubacteria group bacterium GW2011_GWA2_42_28]|nr:MAG: hypothetical protein UV19_C0012G0004 [Parcubacteria group bacterium GW2011_GWA2_42_28]
MATQEEKEQELISRFQQDPLVFKGAFIGMARKDKERLFSEIEEKISKFDAEFKTAEAEMQKAAVALSGAKERLKDIEKGENFGAEFDSLLGNKRIASIDFEPNTGTPEYLVVTTTELCVPLGGKKYWIDPLKIKICMRKGYGSVSVHRSHARQKVGRYGTGAHEGWPAPHVRNDGTLCLGTITGDVDRALRSQDWPLVIEYMIPFLESCNPDRAYTQTLKDAAIRVE